MVDDVPLACKTGPSLGSMLKLSHATIRDFQFDFDV